MVIVWFFPRQPVLRRRSACLRCHLCGFHNNQPSSLSDCKGTMSADSGGILRSIGRQGTHRDAKIVHDICHLGRPIPLCYTLSILKRSEKIMFGEAWSQIKDGENNLADAEHRRWMFSISVDEESQANDTQEGNPKTDGVLVSSSRQYFLSRSQYRSLHQKQPFNIWHLLLLPSLTSSDQRQNGAWTHRYECIPLVLFIGRRQKQQWSCIFDFSGRVYCRNIVFKPCNNNRHFTKEWLFCWWSVQLHTLYSTWPCGTWLLAHAQWRNVVK